MLPATVRLLARAPVLTGCANEREVSLERELLGFVAGFVMATITSPVGVSCTVFLMPVQLSVFGVPSPQVTPTNVLCYVLSGPGALLRYARQGRLHGPLARSLGLSPAGALDLPICVVPSARRIGNGAYAMPTLIVLF